MVFASAPAAIHVDADTQEIEPRYPPELNPAPSEISRACAAVQVVEGSPATTSGCSASQPTATHDDDDVQVTDTSPPAEPKPVPSVTSYACAALQDAGSPESTSGWVCLSRPTATHDDTDEHATEKRKPPDPNVEPRTELVRLGGCPRGRIAGQHPGHVVLVIADRHARRRRRTRDRPEYSPRAEGSAKRNFPRLRLAPRRRIADKHERLKIPIVANRHTVRGRRTANRPQLREEVAEGVAKRDLTRLRGTPRRRIPDQDQRLIVRVPPTATHAVGDVHVTAVRSEPNTSLPNPLPSVSSRIWATPQDDESPASVSG